MCVYELIMLTFFSYIKYTFLISILTLGGCSEKPLNSPYGSENYYNENKFKYITAEKRRVKQIFLSNIKGNKESNSELINTILSKLKSNDIFESLATEYSNDQLSNKKEGDIGWVSRFDLSKNISDIIFNLENINDISEVLSTDQGFYIFKLDNIQEAKVKKFKEVKNIVKRDYEDSQITNRYETIYEDVSNILFENPSSLDKAEEFLSVKKKVVLEMRQK